MVLSLAQYSLVPGKETCRQKTRVTVHNAQDSQNCRKVGEMPYATCVRSRIMLESLCLKKNPKPTYPSVRDYSAQPSLQPTGFLGRGTCHMEVLVCVHTVTQIGRSFSAPWACMPDASVELSAGLWRLRAPVWQHSLELRRKEEFCLLLLPKCLKLSTAWFLEEEICSVISMFRCYGHKILFSWFTYGHLVFGAFFTWWTSRGYFLHWIELSL